VSQQAIGGELDYRSGYRYDFDAASAFVARLVEELEHVPIPQGTLLNVNVPWEKPTGARACRLGKRIYRDRLQQVDEDEGRKRYRIYGYEPGYHEEQGTDFEAVGDRAIAVTPLHFDLTDSASVEALGGFDLDGLLRPAAQEVE
jgi:5'-nucleotidase